MAFLFPKFNFDLDRLTKAVLVEIEIQRQRTRYPLVESQLARELEVFLAGTQGRLPKGWELYLDKAEREASAEYKEYQRLKEKFCE